MIDEQKKAYITYVLNVYLLCDIIIDHRIDLPHNKRSNNTFKSVYNFYVMVIFVVHDVFFLH